MLNMFRFFGAPHCIYLTFDNSLKVPYSMFDMGLVTENICLAATDEGLGTCIMGQVAKYPQVVREVVDIPKEKNIVVGIALGKPDPDAPANSFRSERAPFSESVTFLD
jgi:nitroreductase